MPVFTVIEIGAGSLKFFSRTVQRIRNSCRFHTSLDRQL